MRDFNAHPLTLSPHAVFRLMVDNLATAMLIF